MKPGTRTRARTSPDVNSFSSSESDSKDASSSQALPKRKFKCRSKRSTVKRDPDNSQELAEVSTEQGSPMRGISLLSDLSTGEGEGEDAIHESVGVNLTSHLHVLATIESDDASLTSGSAMPVLSENALEQPIMVTSEEGFDTSDAAREPLDESAQTSKECIASEGEGLASSKKGLKKQVTFHSEDANPLGFCLTSNSDDANYVIETAEPVKASLLSRISRVRVLSRFVGTFARNKSSSQNLQTPLKAESTPPPVLKVGSKRLGVQVHKIMRIGIHVLIISKGDIIDFSGDAIVNAANESAVSGGGVAAAIARAAGPQLNEELRKLPEVRPLVRIPVGQVHITSGYRLKTEKIIHAVGPVYSSVKVQKNRSGGAQYVDWSSHDEKLQNAYKASVGVAAEHNCRSIGFSLLSTGAFCGDRGLEPVLLLGVEAVANSLHTMPSSDTPIEVHLISNSEKVLRPLLKMTKDLRVE
jgi:O-acetyl-ADP-ribose deacetylase (regulator of RNase III)